MNKWLTIGQTPPSILATIPLPLPAAAARMRAAKARNAEILAEIFDLVGTSPFCASDIAALLLRSPSRVREVIRVLNARYPATPIFLISHYKSRLSGQRSSGRITFYTIAPNWRDIVSAAK